MRTRTSLRFTRALLACGLSLAAPERSMAQQPLTGLRLHQEVRVTDDAGNKVEGRVDALTADTLTVKGRIFPSAHVAIIERKGDSLWNGVAIGAAVGIFLPLLPTEACSRQSRAGCIASGIETGALLGLAVDAVHRGYTTIYTADRGRTTARLIPRIDRRSRGVALALSFK